MDRLVETVKNNISYSLERTIELQTEFYRKAIHLLVAFVPMMASINYLATLGLLGAGTILYTIAEKLRFDGVYIPLISDLTVIASRKRDTGRFVLGPVTLAVGAMAALLFYPNVASALAIYALAFGDGLASLVGKLAGRIEIPFTNGKTVAGSSACFLVVLSISLQVTGSAPLSLITASAATLLEIIPMKDFDNILIPAVTGLVVTNYLFLV